MAEEKITNGENSGDATIKSIEGAIEAILYAAGYPVKYEKIAEVLGFEWQKFFEEV